MESDIYRNYGDPSKAEKAMLFKVKIGLAEGFERLMKEMFISSGST